MLNLGHLYPYPPWGTKMLSYFCEDRTLDEIEKLGRNS